MLALIECPALKMRLAALQALITEASTQNIRPIFQLLLERF